MKDDNNFGINTNRFIIVAAVVIGIMMIGQFLIQGMGNKENAERISSVMINEIMRVVDEKQIEEEQLQESLKEDYIIRASAVAYMVEHDPAAIDEADVMKHIAELVSVDEINLFDTEGILFAGTAPGNYGLAMDTSESFVSFLPMLSDRDLSMCQDISGNSVRGKDMMYAATWNRDKSIMVQVGVEPKRLMKQIEENELSEVVGSMPTYAGVSFYVADAETEEILGATDRSVIGASLGEIGIRTKYRNLARKSRFRGIVRGKLSYCTLQGTDQYIYGVTVDTSVYTKTAAASVLIVCAYLLLAGGVIIMMLAKLLSTNRERMEQLAMLTSMSEIYYSMHLIDLRDYTLEQYSAHDRVAEIVAKYEGKEADKVLHEVMEATMSDEYLQIGLEFTEITTLQERMRNKKYMSMDLRGRNVGWIRMSFITIDQDSDGTPEKVIVTTQVIDEEKRREEALILNSNTDKLTHCFNRRAYEDDILKYPSVPTEVDFVFISMDVNGLKVVNDSLGHEAGDELLLGAAGCMQRCLGNFGKIYRVGGDEFVAMIFAGEAGLEEILADFDDAMNSWSGRLLDRLAISYGVVTKREFPDLTVTEMARIADERMYEQKERYYKEQGIDRKGQYSAHKALCGMYNKILKVDLQEDSFHVINMDMMEQAEEMGYAETLSAWLKGFGTSGRVHPEDLELYLEQTDTERLKRQFAKGVSSVLVEYRRKFGDEYKRVVMDLIPADDYTHEHQTLYLYVRAIDN